MTTVKNSYPELNEIDYKKTTVDMRNVIAYIKSLNVLKAVKLAAYTMFRMESGNGQSGINHNYMGIQADSGRWPDFLTQHAVGTVVKKENMSAKERRFLAFDSFESSVDFLIDRIQKRGLYVGGTSNFIVKQYIDTPATWTEVYWKTWVTGNLNAKIPLREKGELVQMYNLGSALF